MIKLNKPVAPDYLDDETVVRLTESFKVTGKNVWNHDDIKSALLLSSSSKCAYCECKLNAESNYMEVEHFEDKSSNPDKVVLWDNLLPSCKRCNGAKGTHNVSLEPIVNPFVNEPKSHLGFKLYRLTNKTNVGKNTIDALNLNHSERAVIKRFEIGEQVLSSINDAHDRYHAWSVGGQTTRSKNILVGGVEGLLLECQPCSSYSATAATVLHNELRYVQLVELLKIEGHWNDVLNELHHVSLGLVLECS